MYRFSDLIVAPAEAAKLLYIPFGRLEGFAIDLAHVQQ